MLDWTTVVIPKRFNLSPASTLEHTKVWHASAVWAFYTTHALLSGSFIRRNELLKMQRPGVSEPVIAMSLVEPIWSSSLIAPHVFSPLTDKPRPVDRRVSSFTIPAFLPRHVRIISQVLHCLFSQQEYHKNLYHGGLDILLCLSSEMNLRLMNHCSSTSEASTNAEQYPTPSRDLQWPYLALPT